MDSGDATPIKAVIFDMDGLLLDSETLSMEATRSAGLALGYPMSPAFCHALIGNALDRAQAMLREEHGPDFPLERWSATHDAHLEALVASGRLAPKAGVAALLDRLDALDLPRAVATSSHRARALHHLEAAAILHRFAHVVSRDDVTMGKPHPEPYLRAAVLLGIAPQRCLALEDSHTGVRAAHAAGMRVIMVPDLLKPTDEMRSKAHRILDSLHEVVAFLDAHRAGA